MRDTTVADLLKKAAVGHFIKKGYGCNVELGIARWGKYKADMVGVSFKGHVVIAEIKSSVADFKGDLKKNNAYMDMCNQAFYVMTEDTHQKLANYIVENKEHYSQWGILVLDSKTGFLRSVKAAKNRKMDGKIKREIILRMAWRNATFSRRNTRRLRVFI